MLIRYTSCIFYFTPFFKFQLVASQEKGSKVAELEAKRKILLENDQLNALFHHLVVNKLITTGEFWGDHFTAVSTFDAK